jgi:hypothetical protein
MDWLGRMGAIPLNNRFCYAINEKCHTIATFEGKAGRAGKNNRRLPIWNPSHFHSRHPIIRRCGETGTARANTMA